MIKAIIFDWGTVLIENPAPKIVAYCSEVLGVNPDRFVIAQNMYLISLQKGQISEPEFWEKVAEELNVEPPTQKSLWGDAFRSGYIERKEMFDLIKNLKEQGYKTGFLSNTEESPEEYFHELGYDALFDVVVFSCKEGVVKPDAEIYRIALQRLNLEPEEAVFIDDKAENTEAAQALGMKVVLFVTAEQAISDLSKLLE